MFQAPQVADRKELAVVAELIGEDGKLILTTNNVADHSKRVSVLMRLANGTENRVNCSKGVSKGIRDKSISIPNLLGFSIFEAKAYQRDNNGDILHDPETGEEMFEAYAQIEMPTGSSNGAFEFTAGKVEEYVAPVLDPSELVAF